ncbi:HD domain-containing phosphohydrolase [Deinococcus cellulosilyticus]|uniref:HD-GYP domain-containing protein n=1 Tax=Deinococcus cellulosilyticus (strain DSM 18568 / NBRC 106333 / KACC 11606 / 5516J-15) TaxID=1223518 RepID=A0A511MZZ0_DEIC1|nr:HD domain-containing phosphohydrolase [Deinococcus cellulosilyticus]GEM46190.1 hypothetical protein DC3_18250 [Deinococcus cellulosilyticus NBRC 106333 = KACC 11606]
MEQSVYTILLVSPKAPPRWSAAGVNLIWQTSLDEVPSEKIHLLLLDVEHFPHLLHQARSVFPLCPTITLGSSLTQASCLSLELPLPDFEGFTPALYQRLLVLYQEHLELTERINEELNALNLQLLQNGTGDFYVHLLESAVRLVPGAQAGALIGLDPDGQYSFKATLGYDFAGLSRIRFTPQQIIGTENELPRTSNLLKFREFNRGKLDPETEKILRESGRIDEIQVSLSTQVRVKDRLAAVLNLENFDSEDAFTPDAIRIAESFADRAALLVQRYMLEWQVQERAHRYKLLSELSAHIETMNTPHEVAETALGTLMQLSQYELFVYYERLAHGWQLQAFRHSVPLPFDPSLLMNLNLHDFDRLPRSVTSREVLDIPDFQNVIDPSPDLLQLGLKSTLLAPVQVQGRVMGVMVLCTFSGHREAKSSEIQVVKFILGRLQNAFERRTYLEQVESTREATLRTLGLALEYRDFETRGHTDRVVDLCERFALRLGLPEEERTELRWGAYLHDVGKIGIPDAILLKPGKLTPEERLKIQEHTLIGAEICMQMPLLPDLTRAVVRSHHEWWDGSGYPDNLLAEQTSLLARIFTIVDVFDALTTERPYKNAWPIPNTLVHMEKLSGKQFDPALLPVFIDLICDLYGVSRVP